MLTRRSFVAGASLASSSAGAHRAAAQAYPTQTIRIVAGFPPGTAITVPRTFVDYVVTEYGIAELRGKSLRQRVGALIEIAHPEFRPELRTQARALYRV